MQTSSLEAHIIKVLKDAEEPFEREKTYKKTRIGRCRFDFYLPNRNILIEVDGSQHYDRGRNRAGQERDRRKNAFALAHDIPLYRIPYYAVFAIQGLEQILVDDFLVKNKWHNDELERK